MVARYKKAFLRTLTSVLIALALTFSFTPIAVQADTYNCGAYGAGAYQNNVCGAQDDGGGLADTGQKIWPILLAVLLILLGTYTLYRTRKKMKDRQAYTIRQ